MGVFPDTNYNLFHRDAPRLSYISSFLRKQEPTAGPGAVAFSLSSHITLHPHMSF